MDWTSKQTLAKRLIDKYGVAMSVVTSSSPATPSYSATADTISATLVTYDTIGVILNPTGQRDDGSYGRFDKVQLLLSSKELPANLDQLEYHVVWGNFVWHPERTIALKPGGTSIIFKADMK